MSTTLLATLAVSLGLNIAMFVVAYLAQTDKLIDFVYGLDFAALAVIGLVETPRRDTYAITLTALVGVWAARLAVFLLVRVIVRGSDSRFDGRRESFFRFGKLWVGQGLVVWIVSIPVLLALHHPARFGVLPVIGLVVWAVGLVVEAMADQQKFAFARDPANTGTWIATGWWRLSRHPNYFGEILVWVGVYLVALPSLDVVEAMVALVSPLLIIALLRFVSGVPILETAAQLRWGELPAHQRYVAETNLLVPWFPRAQPRETPMPAPVAATASATSASRQRRKGVFTGGDDRADELRVVAEQAGFDREDARGQGRGVTGEGGADR